MKKWHLSLPLKVVVLICTVCPALGITGVATKEYRRTHPSYLRLTAEKPMISSPILYNPGSNYEHWYGLALPVCNRSSYPLDVSIKFTDGARELLGSIERTQPSGSAGLLAIGYLGRKRDGFFQVHVIWKQGPKSGKVNYTISPQKGVSILEPNIQPSY